MPENLFLYLLIIGSVCLTIAWTVVAIRRSKQKNTVSPSTTSSPTTK